MNIKEYKNGNITLKLTLEEMVLCTENKDARQWLLWTISDNMFWIDTYIVSDPSCMGNDEMALMLYNTRLDKVYTLLLGRQLTALMDGKTIRLYANTPDKWDEDVLRENGYY